MHDGTVHRPCVPARAAEGGDCPSFSLYFPQLSDMLWVITASCDTTNRNPMGMKGKVMSLVP